MADLYSLAGAGAGTGTSGILSGAGKTMQSLSLPLMFMGPYGMAAGAGLSVLGAGMGLGGSLWGQQQALAEGHRRYGEASSLYQNKIASNPYKYTDRGVRETFSGARKELARANLMGTSNLLDRYSSVQRRLLQNRIRSGLTTGAAQAAAVQNNIAFQQGANRLFQSQGSQLSNLRLREGQALQNMADVVDARKSQLANRELMSQGIVNPAALGGLSAKLVG